MSVTVQEQISKNRQAAVQFLTANWWVASLWIVLIFFFAGATLSDWAIAFSFFAKAGENSIGELSMGNAAVALLKSAPVLAIPFIIKEVFRKLPKWARMVGLIAIFALGIMIAINMGRVQTSLVLKQALENIFPEPAQQANPQLASLLGLGEPMPSVEVVKAEELPPEAAAMISKGAFIESFSWYSGTFLLMAFVGTLCLLALDKLKRKKGQIAMANKVVNDCEKLEELERTRNACLTRVNDLEESSPRLCRATQDIALQVYSSGLSRPRAHLGILKQYGDEGKKAYKKFPFFQIYRPRVLTYIQMDVAERMIQEADQSIRNLTLIDPDQPVNAPAPLPLLPQTERGETTQPHGGDS